MLYNDNELPVRVSLSYFYLHDCLCTTPRTKVYFICYNFGLYVQNAFSWAC